MHKYKLLQNTLQNLEQNKTVYQGMYALFLTGHGKTEESLETFSHVQFIYIRHEADLQRKTTYFQWGFADFH